LLLRLCLGPTFSQAAGCCRQQSKLIALENAWNQAQIHPDGTALNALVADTFIHTDWDGTVMHKA
jgi:hypothetical protein